MTLRLPWPRPSPTFPANLRAVPSQLLNADCSSAPLARNNRFASTPPPSGGRQAVLVRHHTTTPVWKVSASYRMEGG